MTHSHTATHCDTLRHPATPCNTLQHTATHTCDKTHLHMQHYHSHVCGMSQAYLLQHTATHRNAYMQYDACMHATWHVSCIFVARLIYLCDMPRFCCCCAGHAAQKPNEPYIALQRTGIQYTATHCNTMQRTAKQCNTPHRTATHCRSAGLCGGDDEEDQMEGGNKREGMRDIHTHTHTHTQTHVCIYIYIYICIYIHMCIYISYIYICIYIYIYI